MEALPLASDRHRPPPGDARITDGSAGGACFRGPLVEGGAQHPLVASMADRIVAVAAPRCSLLARSRPAAEN